MEVFFTLFIPKISNVLKPFIFLFHKKNIKSNQTMENFSMRIKLTLGDNKLCNYYSNIKLNIIPEH